MGTGAGVGAGFLVGLLLAGWHGGPGAGAAQAQEPGEPWPAASEPDEPKETAPETEPVEHPSPASSPASEGASEPRAEGEMHAQAEPSDGSGNPDVSANPDGSGNPSGAPTPPPGLRMENGAVMVLRDVGIGSPIAYATAGVLELGGVASMVFERNRTQIRLAPSLGYFLVDNLQLTLFPEIRYQRISNDTSASEWIVGALVEPSYHVPLDPRLFVFGGIGVGVLYANDPGFDFVVRPRFGIDLLIGRSGILKPALFLELGVRDGVHAGGIEVGYTILW